MTRKERRKRREKRIINIFFIIVIFVVIFYGVSELYKEKKQEKDNNYQVKRLIIDEYENFSNNSINENNELENKEYPKEKIEEKYKGYDVLAKLEISKINLETYVINFSENALNVSVTKFWGNNPNEIGNFCIAGHNFKNKNMFHNLKKLEVGDKLILKDNSVGCVEYEIYNIYTVVPEDVSCLSQNTNGKKEITLITCTNDSKKRIIIKAREFMENK